MKTTLIPAGVGLLCCFWIASAAGAAKPLVTRSLVVPAGWAPSGYNSASGTIGGSKDVPPQAAAGAESMQIAVDYSGEGFQFFGVEPPDGQIPGKCRRVSVWVKALQPDYSWLLKFKDAGGNETVDGKKLEWGLKAEPGQWKQVELTVPEGWAQPIRLAGISAHNWNRKQQKARAVLLVYGLSVTTDVSGVADRASLVQVQLATGAQRHVFTAPGPVRYHVACASWLGTKLEGTLAYRVSDPEGTLVAQRSRPVAFTGSLAETIEMAPPRLGVYTASIRLDLGTGRRFDRTSRFAYVPKPRECSEAEKKASPYGLNIHGGKPGVAYDAIARLGFTWVRDYAYSRPWMVRARGDDGRYAGWPWYPKMDRRIRDSGLMLLPCLMGAIGEETKAGRLEPNQAWKRDLVHVLWAFPQYPAWELDNEYDYRHGREEAARKWSSYDAFHKLFGRAVHFMNPGVLAVEQGTAGIHPEWVRRAVANGSFDDIDVVNAHFYCGTSPPELSTHNVNVGGEDQGPVLLWDSLRELAAAADSDGRQRQAWITEFGWDTLAGPIVSERQQAVYLQRGYLLGLQAGIDKMFWYWNLDTKEKPKQLFDGCGIFDPREEPKPAAAALAALAHFLKLPEPLGTFDLGPGTMGHVFRDRDGGRLVACAFVVEPDTPPIEVTLAHGELFDMYGNPLAGRTHKLGIEPLWIVDVPPDDPIVLQTSYGLATRRLVRASAGDTLEIRVDVHNRRAAPLGARLAARAPQGWAVEPSQREINVAPGKRETFALRVTLDPKEKAGMQQVQVTVTEGPIERRLVTSFAVLPAAEVTTGPLPSTPGAGHIAARLTNHSRQARSFVLKAELPAGWRAEVQEVMLADVPPGVTREALLPVTWSPRWKPGEAARIAVFNEAGERITECGIIPGAIGIPRVKGIRCDGDLGDWPAAARLPDWAAGHAGPDPGAAIWLGYSQAGLHLAVKVDRAKAEVPDPRSFWAQDCLELFVDTRADPAERKSYRPTDHQFWFCPVVAEKRVYVGRWKRNDEIPATRYDIPGIDGSCRKTPGGYVMEVLLPAAEIRGFSPRKGARLGVNLNLTVPGPPARSEVYWPRAKADDVMSHLHLWGRVELD